MPRSIRNMKKPGSDASLGVALMIYARPHKNIKRNLFLCVYKTKNPRISSHQQALNDGVSVLALIVHHFDVVQVRVGPVHQPVDQVQRDAVREDDLAVYQLGAVLPVHVAALHLGDLPVVGEEHLPADEGRTVERKPRAAADARVFRKQYAPALV